MKTKILAYAILIVCAVPLSSFKVEPLKNVKALKSSKKTFVITYFGSFIYGSNSYDVWGDPATNTVTAVYSCCPSYSVNSFSATYDGVVLHITGYNVNNQYFSHHGRLQYL